MVFLDYWKHDLFVCVVSLDDIRALKIASSFFLARSALPTTTNPQNHPSKRPIPLSSLPSRPKQQNDANGTHNRHPPPKLHSKLAILPTSGPGRPGDLIDSPEIGVDDGPTGPGDGSGGDLGDEVAGGEGDGEAEGEEAEGDEAGVEGGGEEGGGGTFHPGVESVTAGVEVMEVE